MISNIAKSIKGGNKRSNEKSFSSYVLLSDVYAIYKIIKLYAFIIYILAIISFVISIQSFTANRKINKDSI